MNQLKAIAGILLIFCMGTVVGALSTRIVYESRIDAIAEGDTQAKDTAALNRLSRQLDLDENQKARVMIIVREIRQELKRIHEPVRPQTKASLMKGSERIKRILRPDQLEKYEKILAQKELRRKERDKET
jgi:hypothetical protein